MKIKLTRDVYNIANRLKKIDKYYYVVYDTISNKFEVHNSSQIGGSYCLTLPYKVLDERTLEFVYKTQVKNIDRILNEIENENKIRESVAKTDTFSDVYYSLKDGEI